MCRLGHANETIKFQILFLILAGVCESELDCTMHSQLNSWITPNMVDLVWTLSETELLFRWLLYGSDGVQSYWNYDK